MRRLILKPTFDRDWKQLSLELQNKLRDRIFALREMSLPTRQHDIIKLTGEIPTTFRFRIGDYRVIFQYDQHTVTLIHIAHRKDVYR